MSPGVTLFANNIFSTIELPQILRYLGLMNKEKTAHFIFFPGYSYNVLSIRCDFKFSG